MQNVTVARITGLRRSHTMGRDSAKKVVGLRLWDNPETGKKWDCNVVQMKYGILLGLLKHTTDGNTQRDA